MRIAAMAAAWAASLAMAQGADSFLDRAPITLPSQGALYRLALPELAYRDTRADLGDVRVFNARGEAVPIALATEAEATREAPPAVDLPAFAVTSLEAATLASQVTVRLADGTLVAVDGKRRSTPPERRTAGYLLDASALRQPIHALNLDWDVAPGLEIVRVSVEGSDDLRAWHPLAGPVSLVRIEQAGRRLDQPRVPLNGTRSKYLRVTAAETPFALRGARAEFQERARPAELAVKRVPGKPGAKPGEIVYDLEARLPVEAVRLVPGEDNSVIPAAFFVRDTPEGTPGWVAQATFYRLTRDGREIESPPTHIRRRAARYWIVRSDPDKGGVGAALPQLEVHWRPVQLVFVARGEPPFTLAFGNREAKPALLPVSSLIPGYEPHAEDALPEARAGAVTRAPTMSDAWPAWLADLSPRRLALWGILAGAVLLLALMAWRLNRAR